MECLQNTVYTKMWKPFGERIWSIERQAKKSATNLSSRQILICLPGLCDACAWSQPISTILAHYVLIADTRLQRVGSCSQHIQRPICSERHKNGSAVLTANRITNSTAFSLCFSSFSYFYLPLLSFSLTRQPFWIIFGYEGTLLIWLSFIIVFLSPYMKMLGNTYN
jgi:hypothetical protein